MNQVLSTAVAEGLRQRGIEVLEAREAPPNDGGVALGQAWIAIRTADSTGRGSAPRPERTSLAACPI